MTESMKPNAPTKRTSNINPPPQLPPLKRPPSTAQLDLSQAAATIVVFILAILCFFILCAYCRHCSGGGGGARLARGGHRPLMLLHQGGLSYSTSESKPVASLPPNLPLVLYAAGADRKEEKEEEPAGDCVVCLCEFEEDKELKVILGYGHLFHPQCIDAWLVSHGLCLVCRCSQLFGTAIGEGEGEGEGREEVCVDAVGESGGEEGEEEECGASGIREEFGMERRERKEMGGRGREEGKEVEGRRCCCSSSSSSSKSEDGSKF